MGGLEQEDVKKMRVAFLGRGSLGRDVLLGLIGNPMVEVPFIISCDTSPEVGCDHGDFVAIAEKNGIPFYTANSVNGSKWVDLFAQHNIDLAVAMLWLNTLKSEIISTARLGFLNLHGGLLPRYRGNACSNWAILNQETEQGLSVHFMDPGKLDSGPVVLQQLAQSKQLVF